MSESGSCDESRREIERVARAQPERLQGRAGLDWAAWAIRGGCVENLERLIALGVDVNGLDGLQRTPLGWAAEYGSLECAQRLLALGADPYAVPYLPVRTAFSRRHDALAVLLLEHAPPRTNEEERVWCTDAALGNCLHALRWFLERGFPVNRRDSAGGTLLQSAASSADVATLRLIVEHGADVNQPGHAGRTPLMSALLFGRHDNARWLLDHGADPGLATATGSPVTMMGSSLAAPDPDLLQRLLPHDRPGAGAADADGDTALHHACRRGSAAAVRVLLERGAAIEARNRSGETPLAVVWPGWGDRVACVDALLAHGADPRARNRDGRWVSEFAAIHGEPRVVKALQRQAEERFPASIDPVDWDAQWHVATLVAALLGKDATGVAQWIESPPVAPDRLLRIVSLDPRRVLFLAVELGSVELTRRLLDAGVDVDAADGDGNTALNIAARHGRVDVATLLLDRGADIEARTERGYTPIQFAHDEAMIRLLRKRGARTRS